MERNELYEWAVIFGVYGWMIVSGVIFYDQRTYKAISDIASMAGMVSFLFIKEAYVQVVASKYLYLRCVLRPTNKIMHLFVKRGGFSSVASVKNPNFFTTTLPVMKTNIKDYGEVEKVILKHEYIFDQRVIPAQGKCNYKGNIVDHRGTATLILYDFPEAGRDVDHAEPVPTYYLKDAPGDFMIGPINPLANAYEKGSAGVQRVIQNLQRKILVIEQALTEKTRQASYWHQEAIKFEGAHQLTKEELSGKLQDRPEHMRGVYRYVASLYNDEEKLKQLKGKTSPWRMLLKPWMGLVVITGLGMVFLSTRPEILQGMGEFINDPSNQVWLLLIAVIAVGGIYSLTKILRKKRT